jgi:Mrp family chromosome partitioning ATPase
MIEQLQEAIDELVVISTEFQQTNSSANLKMAIRLNHIALKIQGVMVENSKPVCASTDKLYPVLGEK